MILIVPYLSLSSILKTGIILGGVYYYVGQRQGGGYVEEPNHQKNYLKASDSLRPGIYITIVTGLGSHNKKYVFAPLGKTFWFAISATLGIEVLPGNELGKISLNMSHARDNQDELMRYAAGLVAYIGHSNPGYGGPYTPEMAAEDFCITLTEVRAINNSEKSRGINM